MEKWVDSREFRFLILNKIPILDVRAPLEFIEGCFPNSTNIPILNNEERAQVGLAYKLNGKDYAINLGHQIVCGKNKDSKLQSWVQFIRENPHAVISCFRGGMRSGIAQEWLRQEGISIPRIKGGYKELRSKLIESIQVFPKVVKFIVISGPTGSGKTHFLNDSKDIFPNLNLEKIAKHRGSAFGKLDEDQPAQVNFENSLAQEMILLENKFIVQDNGLTYDQVLLIEDESRMIGKCVQPESLFLKLRGSEIIWLDEDLNSRVENIFIDYIEDAFKNKEEFDQFKIFEKYDRALSDISKKLGGLLYSEIKRDLHNSRLDYTNNKSLESNKIWIRKLLQFYYDPLYFKSLDRRNPKILFKGTKKESLEFLKWKKQNQHR